MRQLLCGILIVCGLLLSACTDDKTSESNLLGKGLMFYANGENEKAIETFKQAIRLNQNDAAAYNALGGVYLAIGEYNKAIEASRQALRLKDYAANYLILGEAYFHKGDFDKAREAFEQAVSRGSYLANAHYYLAIIYSSNKQYVLADDQYKKLYKLDPTLAGQLYEKIY